MPCAPAWLAARGAGAKYRACRRCAAALLHNSEIRLLPVMGTSTKASPCRSLLERHAPPLPLLSLTGSGSKVVVGTRSGQAYEDFREADMLAQQLQSASGFCFVHSAPPNVGGRTAVQVANSRDKNAGTSMANSPNRIVLLSRWQCTATGRGCSRYGSPRLESGPPSRRRRATGGQQMKLRCLLPLLAAASEPVGRSLQQRSLSRATSGARARPTQHQMRQREQHQQQASRRSSGSRPRLRRQRFQQRRAALPARRRTLASSCSTATRARAVTWRTASRRPPAPSVSAASRRCRPTLFAPPRAPASSFSRARARLVSACLWPTCAFLPACLPACRPDRYRGAGRQGGGGALHARLLPPVHLPLARPQAALPAVQGPRGLRCAGAAAWSSRADGGGAHPTPPAPTCHCWRPTCPPSLLLLRSVL